jgi:predicted RNA-binding Zn-ribbon protein involved in translation (DUF1610 family)
MIKEHITCHHCEYLNILLDDDLPPFYCDHCGKRLITFAEHSTLEQARYIMKIKKDMEGMPFT